MSWKTKWGCKCGAIWGRADDYPPVGGVCPTCSGPLTRMPDKPLLTDAWDAKLGPELPRKDFSA